MDVEELKALFDEGMSFEAAYEELYGDDMAYAVEAFEYWTEWDRRSPSHLGH